MPKTRDFHQLFIFPDAYWVVRWAVRRDVLDLGGRNKRETKLQEIALCFTQSVNKHCTVLTGPVSSHAANSNVCLR
jgi:hypothetical protein